MADFRKWFLVIAVLLATAVAASAASSQTTITCTSSASPAQIRNGGVTEVVNEVDLSCDSTHVVPPSSGQPVWFNLVYSFNAEVTNAQIANTTGDHLGPLTMAGVVVQYEAFPQTVIHTVQGRVIANNLTFPKVVVPLGTKFDIRFIDARVSTQVLLSIHTTGSGVNEILGFINVNGVNPSGWSLSMDAQVSTGIVVATIYDPLQFAITDCAGAPLTGNPNITFQQCVDTHMEGEGEGRGRQTITPFGLTFTEGTATQTLPTAFKNLVEEDGTSLGPGTLDPAAGVAPYVNPAQMICDTNHQGVAPYGTVMDDTALPFGVPVCVPTSPAWVSNGTRLLAQFTVPANLVGKIHIWVTEQQTSSNAATTAQLVTIHSDTGTGFETMPWAGLPVVNCNDDVTGGTNNAWMKLPDGPTETAAWELTSDDQGTNESITFGWAISYKANELPTGVSFAPITIQGTLAPISLPANVAKSVPLATDAVVRFNNPLITDHSVSITVDHCVTNLLYPYVTNIAGYNTGIAIANTSLDTAWNLNPPPASPQNGTAPGAIASWGTVDNPQPFDTTPQSGPCDLYLFGSASPVMMTLGQTWDGGPVSELDVQAIASGPTPPIAAGQVFADVLGSIFNLGNETITAYVIARCEFQFAHGYAFILTPGLQPQSYLALIIPDRNVLDFDVSTGIYHSRPIRIAKPFTEITFDPEGEMLAP